MVSLTTLSGDAFDISSSFVSLIALSCIVYRFLVLNSLAGSTLSPK